LRLPRDVDEASLIIAGNSDIYRSDRSSPRWLEAVEVPAVLPKKPRYYNYSVWWYHRSHSEDFVRKLANQALYYHAWYEHSERAQSESKVQKAAAQLCTEHPSIEVDPDIFNGAPHVKGTYVAVSDILGCLSRVGNVEAAADICLADGDVQMVKEALVYTQQLLDKVYDQEERTLSQLTSHIQQGVRLTRSPELLSLARQVVASADASPEESIEDWANRLARDVVEADD
jgi:uncharacterized protein (DUF433 family)